MDNNKQKKKNPLCSAACHGSRQFFCLNPLFLNTIPEEVQLRCILGSMHMPLVLGVKVQGRLTKFPVFFKLLNIPNETKRLT
jgi:hypothetical protein